MKKREETQVTERIQGEQKSAICQERRDMRSVLRRTFEPLRNGNHHHTKASGELRIVGAVALHTPLGQIKREKKHEGGNVNVHLGRLMLFFCAPGGIGTGGDLSSIAVLKMEGTLLLL